MAVKDLNIEFEEEGDSQEEERKKKSAVVEDVDLDFDVLTDPNTPASDVAKAQEAVKAPAAKPAAAKAPAPGQKPQAPAAQKDAVVKPIRPEASSKPAATSAPAAAAAPTPAHVAQTAPAAQEYVQPAAAAPVYQAPAAGSHYQLGDELKRVMNGNQILAIELEAKVKVEVAERMVVEKATQAQENKMLERDITKLLKQIMAKAPQAKNEILQIQKLVQDFATVDKSKKKKGEDAA